MEKKYYYKALMANCESVALSYKLGINEIPKDMDINEDGIYFTSCRHIFQYLNYGPIIAEITIPDDAIVIEDGEKMYSDGPMIDGWRANKVNIENFLDITDLNTFVSFIANGAELDDGVVLWALHYAPKIYEFLNDKCPIGVDRVLKNLRTRELDS